MNNNTTITLPAYRETLAALDRAQAIEAEAIAATKSARNEYADNSSAARDFITKNHTAWNTDEEREAALRPFHAERDRLLKKIKEFEDRERAAAVNAELHRQNSRAAFIAEAKTATAATLEKYAGKRIGEKTREKINNELSTLFGCRAYFSSSMHYVTFCNSLFGSDYLEFRRNRAGDHYSQFTGTDGKLEKIDTAELYTYSHTTYTPNIEETAAELFTAAAAVAEATAALEKAKSAYNAIADGRFVHLYHDNTVFTTFFGRRL